MFRDCFFPFTHDPSGVSGQLRERLLFAGWPYDFDRAGGAVVSQADEQMRIDRRGVAGPSLELPHADSLRGRDAHDSADWQSRTLAANQLQRHPVVVGPRRVRQQDNRLIQSRDHQVNVSVPIDVARRAASTLMSLQKIRARNRGDILQPLAVTIFKKQRLLMRT